MAKYTSGRQKNLKVGISSYSENLTSLEVIGNVGIGTTNAISNLHVVGNGYFTGFITAGYFVGDGSGLINLGLSGNYAPNAGVATYASTAGIATYASNAGIATYATSAGIATYASNAGIATYASNAGIATYASNAGVATYASTAGIATYASNAGIATYATSAGIATYASNAGIATYASNAGIATYASNAGVATYASTAGIATYASNAGIATYATSAGIATYASNAGIATYASNAGIATYATSAGIATYASNAGIATYASNAGIATYASNAGIATYASNAGIATALQNSRTFEITGDIVASPISFNGTGNVSLAATIQPNSVALGTDTTGDYVQSVSGTANQITVTSGTGEGSAPTLSIPNQFTVPQDATVTRDLQVNRNLNVNGNITLGGTTAFINVQELKIADPDIVLGVRTDAFNNDISTDNTANHGGIAIASTEGFPLVQLYNVAIGETNPATYKKIMWFKSGSFTGLNTDAWLMNYAVGIGSTQFPTGTRLAAGSVQFTERDLTVVRNINASGIITGTLANTLTLNTSGTGLSGSTTYNNSGAATFTVTSNATNSNTPSTIVSRDAYGNFSAGVVTATTFSGNLQNTLTLNTSGTGLSGSATFNNSGAATFTVTSNATSANTASTIVARDASGNFSAGTISANLTGTASTASFATTAYNLTDAANITTGTINSSRLSGTYNINISGNAASATYASNAGISTYASTAGIATYASTAGIATYATSSGISTYASTAGIATYASTAGIATYASNAGIATYATSAGIATYAPNAGIATYATSSGISTNLKGGLVGNIPYQSATDTTVFLANGSSGTILQSNGVGNVPSWVTPAPAGAITGITVRDEGTIVGGANSITSLNFVGSIVSVASTLGIATITFLNYVSNAGIATYASTAGIATYASNAGIATYATSAGIATYASNAGIATYASNAGIATNVIGGISSVTQLQVTGISTFTDGPVFIGTATSTGTVNQRFQVTGGGYFSGRIGIGTTNPNVIGANDNCSVLSLYSNGANNNARSVLELANPVAQSNGSVLGDIYFTSARTSVTGFTTEWSLIRSLLTGSPSSFGYGTAISFHTKSNNGAASFRESARFDSEANFLIGSTSSTGTASQPLQVTGGAYVSDNLGIGSTNPTSKLYVVGDGYFTGILTANRIISSVYGEFTGGSISGTNIVGTALSISGISTFTSGPIFIGSATSTGTANQRLQVVGGASFTGTGYNIGVGTTNPLYTLTVTDTGTPATTGLTNCLADFTTTANSYGQINLRNTSTGVNASSDIIVTADNGSDTTNFIDLGINNSAYSVGSWTINGANDGYLYTSDGNLSIGAINASVAKYISFFTGGTLISNERMRINATGVGIGTTNPQHKLDCTGIGRFTESTNSAVSGSGAEVGFDVANSLGFIQSYNRSSSSYLNTAVDGASVLFRISGTEKARIDSFGNLGIGTNNPADNLHLQGIFRIDRQLSAQDQSYIRYFRQGAERARFGLLAADNAIFFNANATDSANHLVINNSGNVLLGTASATGTASQPLQVTGGAYVSGNLGIGTTNPQYPLQVQGNARVTGAIYDSSNSPGTSGQVLQSTVTGTQWTTAASGGVDILEVMLFA